MTVLVGVVEYIKGVNGTKITLEELVAGTGKPRKPVLRVLDRLAKGGFITEISDAKARRGYKDYGPAKRDPVWEIITKPVMEDFTPIQKKTARRDKMWRLIRAKRRFTRRDLVRIAGVTIGSASDFTKRLEQYEFIRFTGRDGHQKVYMLVKDPGPKRPVTPEVKKKNVE